MPDVTIEQLRELYVDARRQWTVDTAMALNEIAEFAMSLRSALGEVSRDEALTALKDKAAEAIERLR